MGIHAAVVPSDIRRTRVRGGPVMFLCMRGMHLVVSIAGLAGLVAASGCARPGAPQVLIQDGPATEPGPDPSDPTAGEFVQDPRDEETGESPDGNAGESTDADADDASDAPVDPPPGADDPSGDGAASQDPDGSSDPPSEDASATPPPPDPEPPQDPLAACPRVRIDVAAGNTLNVRPGPSTSGSPLDALSDGRIVDVLDIVDGQVVNGVSTWYEVDTGSVAGFISAAYAACTLEEPPPFDGFRLPLACGAEVRIAQGNYGSFSHQGRSRYAYDFSIPRGTPMVAMAPGVILATHDATGPGDPCYNGGGESCFPYANYVAILHPDGTASIYKHLDRVDVEPGDEVAGGQQIGLSGSTGYSTGPHAHVMRQQDCGTVLSCESVPLVFLDVPGDGEPETDAWVTSGNCP